MKLPCVRPVFPAVLLLGLMVFAGAAQGETLASYQFANANVTGSATHVSGGTASWTLTGGTVGFGGGVQSAYATTNALPSSFDETKYLTFTLTADSGYVLNLSSLTFDLGGNVNGSSSTTVSAQLRTNAGTTPYDTALSVSPGSTTTAAHTILSTDSTTRYTTFTVDLSGQQFQGQESITFRLYTAAANSSSTLFLRFDNFAVEGAVVSSIPEPATIGLLAGGGALLLALACRSRLSRKSGVRPLSS